MGDATAATDATAARLSESVLNKYEITKILSIRIQQVSNGGALFVERGENESIDDAVQRELVEKRCPLMLLRRMPDKTKRKYRVRDMVVREDLLQPVGLHV